MNLIQLPNGDLWRGHEYKKTGEGNVDITPLPRPFGKLDAAMAAILQFSNGNPNLTCVWCGLQGDTKFMREHLKKDHASIVEPPSEAQLAAAAIELNKEQSAKVDKTDKE